VTVADGRAYVTGYRPGVQIIDVSDPTTPRRLGEYVNGDTAPLGRASGVAIVDSLAYVCNHPSALEIVDVSHPAQPRRIGAAATSDGGSPIAVVVSAGHAYVADHLAGLTVVDVTNPASPAVAASLDLGGPAWGVAVREDYAYVADAGYGLHVVDISNPRSPVRVASLSAGRPGDVHLSDGHAFLASGGDVYVIDVAEPTRPAIVGYYHDIWYGQSLALDGRYIYRSGAGDILDVSNPASPRPAGSIDTRGWPYDEFYADGHLFVADDTGGLAILAVHFPGDLNCDGSFDAFDIEPFIDVMLDPVGFAADYPDCEQRLADMNGDGVVDGRDVDPFVRALTRW
jgi:hypothetical protein